MGGTLIGHDRRVAEGFFERFIFGRGVDIGWGAEPLTPKCDRWDMPQGDAQFMKGVADETFEWVYSSHCLEHINDPREALENWWRILKKGGHLIVAVPDFILYEQGVWPSKNNTEHKTRWTVEGGDGCISLREELTRLPNSELIYCRLVDTNFDYSPEMAEIGQSGTAEVIVEGVVRKNA